MAAARRRHWDLQSLGELTDFARCTLRAARKHGLKTIVYYSVGLDSNPDPRFKDWVCLNAQGRPMGLAFPTDWMSFHSPYRQFVIDHLVEILKMHGPFDGFWLDQFGHSKTAPLVDYLMPVFGVWLAGLTYVLFFFTFSLTRLLTLRFGFGNYLNKEKVVGTYF